MAVGRVSRCSFHVFIRRRRWNYGHYGELRTPQIVARLVERQVVRRPVRSVVTTVIRIVVRPTVGVPICTIDWNNNCETNCNDYFIASCETNCNDNCMISCETNSNDNCMVSCETNCNDNRMIYTTNWNDSCINLSCSRKSSGFEQLSRTLLFCNIKYSLILSRNIEYRQ